MEVTVGGIDGTSYERNTLTHGISSVATLLYGARFASFTRIG
jgi:hypothetical protein